MTPWIDVSIPIREGMVHWPDNPAVQIAHLLDFARGDGCRVSTLSLGTHTGTHVDAPAHFVATGHGIDDVPLEHTIGPARVIEIRDPRSIEPDELEEHHLRAGERVLFKTRNSSRAWAEQSFLDDYVFLGFAAARYLIERGVQTVGIDYLSVAGADDGVRTHRLLLEADVCIIEGLDLRAVWAGPYELVCLPLRIENGDGSPARVVVRRL
jgi:arylformamidase